MNKLISILGISIALAGCNTTRTITVTDTVVVKPPQTLFNCPQIGPVPNPETLTNQEVADFIAKLYRYNKICGINMTQIEKYVADAEKTLKQ